MKRAESPMVRPFRPAAQAATGVYSAFRPGVIEKSPREADIKQFPAKAAWDFMRVTQRFFEVVAQGSVLTSRMPMALPR